MATINIYAQEIDGLVIGRSKVYKDETSMPLAVALFWLSIYIIPNGPTHKALLGKPDNDAFNLINRQRTEFLAVSTTPPLIDEDEHCIFL